MLVTSRFHRIWAPAHTLFGCIVRVSRVTRTVKDYRQVRDVQRHFSAVHGMQRASALTCVVNRKVCCVLLEKLSLPKGVHLGPKFISNWNVCASGATTYPQVLANVALRTTIFYEKSRNLKHKLLLGNASVNITSRHLHSLLGGPSGVEPSSHCVGCAQSFRRKSGKRRGRDMNEQESDEEELDDDDYDAPTNFKKIKIFVKSLRADSVISSALDISRNRVDEIFFGSRLRVNGDKLLKKSKQLDEGDYVDLVVDRSADVEDHVLVKRVKIIGVSPDRTNKDRLGVTVKVWKVPFPVQDAARSR